LSLRELFGMGRNCLQTYALALSDSGMKSFERFNMQGEYTSQLQEIAKALKHHSTPSWVVAIVSGFLGFMASALGQVFQHWYGEYKSCSKMRTIIYSELGAMYSMLVFLQPKITSTEKKENFEYEADKFRRYFIRDEDSSGRFEGEIYAEDNKDVFIQLRERSQITFLYKVMRDSCKDDDDFGFLINSGLAIEIIEDNVRFNWLPKKYVTRYMSPPDAAAIQLAIQRRLVSGHAVPDSEISNNPYERDPYE
jgi:hypothetical protein